MADVALTEISSLKRTQVFKWTGVTESDQFQQIDAGGQVSDVTIVMTGTPGGVTINFQGSHDESTWINLKEPDGTEIALTSANSYAALRDVMPFLRPRRSGGSGTNINVTVSTTRSG